MRLFPTGYVAMNDISTLPSGDLCSVILLPYQVIPCSCGCVLVNILLYASVVNITQYIINVLIIFYPPPIAKYFETWYNYWENKQDRGARFGCPCESGYAVKLQEVCSGEISEHLWLIILRAVQLALVNSGHSQRHAKGVNYSNLLIRLQNLAIRGTWTP